MSEQIATNRYQRLYIYLPKNEYDSIAAQALNSSSHNLSAFCRKLLLHQSPTIFYRNRSLDDFMEEMIILRNELSCIRTSFREYITKNPGFDSFQHQREWIIGRETMEKILVGKLEQINIKIYSISDQWLR